MVAGGQGKIQVKVSALNPRALPKQWFSWPRPYYSWKICPRTSQALPLLRGSESSPPPKKKKKGAPEIQNDVTLIWVQVAKYRIFHTPRSRLLLLPSLPSHILYRTTFPRRLEDEAREARGKNKCSTIFLHYFSFPNFRLTFLWFAHNKSRWNGFNGTFWPRRVQNFYFKIIKIIRKFRN